MSGCVTVGELHLYADDTMAFVIGDNTEEVIDVLNILARDIYNWCNKNKLTVYTGKSEVLIIHNKSFKGPLLPVKMGDTVLKYVTLSDVLGVRIDNKLCWKCQANELCKTYSKKIGMIKRLRYLSPSLLEEIYYKIVIPQISYCMLVWGSCSDALFTQLENEHIRAARIIYKVSEKVCNHNVLRTVKWQNLEYIYKRRLASEMFKIVKDSGNHRLSSHFTVRETERKGIQLVVKRMNTEKGRNSVTYHGPIIWNALSNSLREEVKLELQKEIKNQLKNFGANFIQKRNCI